MVAVYKADEPQDRKSSTVNELQKFAQAFHVHMKSLESDKEQLLGTHSSRAHWAVSIQGPATQVGENVLKILNIQ